MGCEAHAEKGWLKVPIELAEDRRADGAYAHVRQGLEQELELHRQHFASAPFQMQGQLDDVRSGRPVRVTARWLPPGTRAVAEVVVVHPDDRIAEADVGWAAQWLAETDI